MNRLMRNARLMLPSALLLAGTFSAQAHAAEVFNVDPTHTQTLFSINHLGYSTVSGNFHDIKGTVQLDNSDLSKSSLDVTIGTGSIDTGVAARDANLRTPTFFNVDKFPTMTFKSTRVVVTGKGAADVEGTLTLLGVSKPVTLHATVNREAADQMRRDAVVVGVTAHGTLKRSDFGMKAYLPNLGDEVQLAINFEGIKQ
jgi:polyisoprenoid-binding protein YceI